MKNYIKTKPKVSIIVVCLNDALGLEITIKSVAIQTYKNIELVIIDGGSKDNTRKVVRRYQKYVNYFISEPDKGISDAFNKGIKASTGDFINFQGAGDRLHTKDVVERMLASIDPTQIQMVCGRINRVSQDNKLLFTSRLSFKPWRLLYKMALPHQALFTHRNYFKKWGLFDLNCRFAMDYELLLRAYEKFPKVIQKDIIVSDWKAGGVGADKTMEVLAEYDKIRRKNKVAPPWVLSLINTSVRLKYLAVGK